MGNGLAQICLSADQVSGHRPSGRGLMRGAQRVRARTPLLQSPVQGLAGQRGFLYDSAVPVNDFRRCGLGRSVCRRSAELMGEDRGDIFFGDVAGSGTRQRPQGRLPATRVYLYYGAEQTPDSTYDGRVFQSVSQGLRAGDAESGSEGTPERAEQ